MSMADTGPEFAWWCDRCTSEQGRPVASEDCAGHACSPTGDAWCEVVPGHEDDECPGCGRPVSAEHHHPCDPTFAEKLKSMQFLLPGPFRAQRGKVD